MSNFDQSYLEELRNEIIAGKVVIVPRLDLNMIKRDAYKLDVTKLTVEEISTIFDGTVPHFYSCGAPRDAVLFEFDLGCTFEYHHGPFTLTSQVIVATISAEEHEIAYSVVELC